MVIDPAINPDKMEMCPSFACFRVWGAAYIACGFTYFELDAKSAKEMCHVWVAGRCSGVVKAFLKGFLWVLQGFFRASGGS